MTHFICLEHADSAEEAIEAHLESLHNTTKGTFTTARSASRGRHDKSSYWHFTCKYARHQQAMHCNGHTVCLPFNDPELIRVEGSMPSGQFTIL